MIPYGHTNAPVAFMDLISRVFRPHMDICGGIHRQHFDIFKGQGRACQTSKNYATNLKLTPIICSAKEMHVLIR